MLSRFLTIATYLVFLSLTAPAQYAQQTRDKTVEIANPSAISFVLTTANHKNVFHLGERIEILEAYSSSVPGMYSLLQNPKKIEGGATSSLAISPSAGVIDRLRNDGRVTAVDILNSNCAGGSGGGIFGACGDCDGVYKLATVPVRQTYPLNYRFAITVPGHYRLEARAANVALSNDLTKAIPIKSTVLEIEVLRDDNWSHQQLQMAVDRFEEARRKYFTKGWSAEAEVADPAEAAEQMKVAIEILDCTETIRFIDTAESLREAVRLYDGAPRTALFENQLLKAILESRHRDLAVPLLANRMTDEDFAVSADFVDTLTAMTVQGEQPVIFERDDLSSRQQLNPRTLEILRGYVLELGNSLPSKRDGVRALGLATFEHYASEEYCAGEPLIEKPIADQILLQIHSK
jgi:hypothetical protein